jgi:hypothetical protein
MGAGHLSPIWPAGTHKVLTTPERQNSQRGINSSVGEQDRNGPAAIPPDLPRCLGSRGSIRVGSTHQINQEFGFLGSFLSPVRAHGAHDGPLLWNPGPRCFSH